MENLDNILSNKGLPPATSSENKTTTKPENKAESLSLPIIQNPVQETSETQRLQNVSVSPTNYEIFTGLKMLLKTIDPNDKEAINSIFSTMSNLCNLDPSLSNYLIDVFQLGFEYSADSLQQQINEKLGSAVWQRDSTLTEQLLKCGANANYNDEAGQTLLMIAVQLEEPELVKLLLAHGADPNAHDQHGKDALLLAAVGTKNIEITRLLIENGAALKWYSLTNAPNRVTSVLDIIKTGRSKNYKEISNIIKKMAPEVYKDHKNFTYLKMVSNANWMVGHLIINRGTKQEQRVELTGAASSHKYYATMGKMVDKFQSEYAGLLHPKEGGRLQEALKFAGINPPLESIFERIQSGAPTLVNSGYKEHAVTFLFWNGTLAVCNRGHLMRVPIEFHAYDPDKLNMQTVKRIMEPNLKKEADYQNLIKELPAILGEEPESKKFQVLETLSELLAPQIVGNCPWVSAETGGFALLLLGKLFDQNIPLEDIDEAKAIGPFIKTLEEHQQLLMYTNIELLDKYLESAKEGPSESDTIVDILLKLSGNPLSSSGLFKPKIDDLEKQCKEGLSKEALERLTYGKMMQDLTEKNQNLMCIQNAQTNTQISENLNKLNISLQKVLENIRIANGDPLPFFNEACKRLYVIKLIIEKEQSKEAIINFIQKMEKEILEKYNL